MTTTPSQPTAFMTLEQLRADVARMIGEPPEEIALDDNLLDWGLDSMRLLSLLIDWNEAGLKLDISELSEHTTLNGWWRVIQRHQQEKG